MKGERELLTPGGYVLAVDDQEQNLELLDEMLTAAGYKVALASDGEAALAEIERRQPDCIVLDIMMPRMDGYEVCSRLKADPKTRFIPILMLTALAEVADKVKGLEVGADDFLNKPVRREELLARIRSLVKIKRLRDELDTSESIIVTMVRALESKDPHNAGHSERVAASSMATAHSLGLPRSDFEAAGKGSLLHDVGKLGIPEDVLWAPRPLSAEAEAIYRKHPILGEKILAPLRSLAASLDVVRHHHERLDGSGYPDALSGNAISAPTRIVAVANLYDDYVHAGSLAPGEAASRLRDEAGRGLLDGEIVEAFLRAGVAALGKGGVTLSDPWNDLAPMPDVGTGRILICDDTPTNREVLHEVLEDAGFQVVSVDSGEALLPAVAEEKPDLIILDIRMPGLDGFEVCEWIKRNPETEFLPVILVTALSELRNRLRSAQAGADDFLSLPVNRLELVARVRSLLRLRMYYRDLEAHQSVVLSLASVLEAKDPYTKGHSARVGELGARLAREVGFAPEDCELMKVAGLLHDIGKVGIPEALINKPGRLTEEEFLTIMTHPGNGERLCRPLRTVHAALPMIRYHHERYDGKGYPDQLKGEAIPLGARVLALADAFDALTSNRSYRKRLPGDEALAILARETVEGHWDPAIYAALAAMVRREPAGSAGA
jgi:putative two-component system response regulator